MAKFLVPLALLPAAIHVSADDANVPFARRTIDDQPPARPYYKMLGDLDGDGYLDIIIGGAQGPLVCYRYPSWQKTVIADGNYKGVRGDVADIDQDGDSDIVMGGVVWFSNPRIGGGQWLLHRIDARTAHDVELGDLDLDGKLDVVARDQSAFGKSGDAIFVYQQQNPDSWNKHTIHCPHGEGITLADIDRDQDLDIVIGGRWYENTRQIEHWSPHSYTDSWAEPDAKVGVADINKDGRLDIVLTPAELRGERYKVAWYEAPENPQKQAWREHVIVPDIEAVIHSLGLGDFDLDGDTDVAIAEMHQGDDPDEVSLFLNSDRGANWRQQVLSEDGSHDIAIGDLGADGDLDIVGSNHSGDFQPVELWENTTRGG
jgi:hypothetical protein